MGGSVVAVAVAGAVVAVAGADAAVVIVVVAAPPLFECLSPEVRECRSCCDGGMDSVVGTRGVAMSCSV